MSACLTPQCRRPRREPVRGITFAHCEACMSRLTREAFGPVSWVDRAITHTLPPFVVGGRPGIEAVR